MVEELDADGHEVTVLLSQMAEGDSAAMGRLLPLVYAELRRRAGARMKNERRDHTLQPTALVHEAYMRMVGDGVSPTNRAHFFALAATTMRRILVEHARRKNAEKRDGAWDRVPLNEGLIEGRSDVDVLEINDALEKLKEFDERMARVVEMRFFGGLSVEEVEQVLDVNERTIKRDWRVARTLLVDALQDGEPSDAGADGP